MPKLTVESTKLENPKWPGISLKPGDTTTMQVDAPQIKPDQFIEFRIRQGDDVIDSVKGAAGKTSATWKVPNLPHSPKLKFDAVLTAKASPKNGFQAVLAKVTSPEADLQGFKVEITASDAAFVPHTENLQITYNVTDTGGAAVNGRYEIWGERYPDDKPLYTVTFTPAAGAKTWSWDGKANQGKNSGKYISPEFSPYRVRIIIGISQGLVDDAFGAGISQVAAAEQPFEVAFQSVQIRLQAGITEAAAAAPANAKYLLNQALAIEPYAPAGTYAAMGRLPTSTPAETGRIRIPMACHQRGAPPGSPAGTPATDVLDQGSLAIQSAPSNYLPAGSQPKATIDAGFYTRPEIPLEFELHLRSRDGAKNTAPGLGVFDKEAIGPAKIEPFAEDVFQPAIYTGGGLNQTYWRKSAFKVKKGQQHAPVNGGALPVFDHWQARLPVTGALAATPSFDLDTFDAGDNTYRFVVGSNELMVWLNRTKLVLGPNQAALDSRHADYIEVDTHTIKLRSNLARVDDVLWIVRSAAAGPVAVADWQNFPPGTNCHKWYGGLRGDVPTNGLFKKAYSAPGAAFELVIGKATGAYPYGANNFVNLGPDPGVPANSQERVEVSAKLAADAQQGLAGVLFSPSFMAGDSYAINAFVDAAPYERNLGWVNEKPAVQSKTGTMSVWRLMTITTSLRLQDKESAGIVTVTITNGGTGYTAADVGRTVTFSAQDDGSVAATGTIAGVDAGGAVTGINITNNGSGYTSATITLPAPATPGTQATASASLLAATVDSATVTNGGSGYTPAQIGAAVTISGQVAGGVAATGTIAAVNATGAVTSVTVSNQGSGFTTGSVTLPPPIGGGTQAAGTVSLKPSGVVSAPLTNGGTGYTAAQVGSAVIFSAPQLAGGVTATGVIGTVSGGAVTAITITNQGSGYTGATVTLPAPATAGAQATATTTLAGTLGAGVGCTPEIPIGARTYMGDGVNMSLSGMNTILVNAFNEWTMPPPGAGAPAGDVHKNVPFAAYIAANNGLPLGAGLVTMAVSADIKNAFVAFDHYRVRLPRGIPNGTVVGVPSRINAATNAIATLPPGTRSAVAMAKVQAALAALAAGAADPPLSPLPGGPAGATIPAIMVSPQAPGPYGNWVLGQIRANRGTLLNALTPQVAQPKTMQVLRWPDIHDSPIWNDATAWATNSMTILGTSLGNGQSIFVTSFLDPTTFPHEMGHSAHLAHFVGGNFVWKHHNLLQPDCMMSYSFTTGFIVQPAGPPAPVGLVPPAAATVDNGWPGVVPAAALMPGNASIIAGAAAATPCIQLDAIVANGHLPPGNPCSKCMLKLRGWQELNLPCAWNHPDLF